MSVPPAHAPAEQRKLPREAVPLPPWSFPAWPVSALSIPILARASIFVIVLSVEPWRSDPDRIVPAWVQILQALSFAALAFVLLHYGRDDRRARVLGLFVLDAAATLVTPFVRAIDNPSPLAWLGLRLRTDAFQAALLWYFAGVFPRPAARPSLARAFHVATAAAFALGVLLVAADGVAALANDQSQGAWIEFFRALRREPPQPREWYFGLQFLLLAPAPLLLQLKLRDLGPGDRRRFLLLMAGLLLGLLPLVADVLLTAAWPTYVSATSTGAALRIKGAIIVIALTLVPLAGAWAALVQRTLDVRVILRRAIQYVLARWFVRAAAILPFVAFGALVVANREKPVVELASGGVGATLGLLAAAGLAAAVGRDRLLSAIDRRFFRQQVDTKETLLGLAEALRRIDSVDAARAVLVSAMETAFHPATIVIAVAGDDDRLHALDADLPPLPRGSALVQLLAARDLPLVVGDQAPPILERLGAGERRWLAAAGAAVVVPLRGTGNEVLGAIVLGEKLSELPYSTEDLGLMAAEAGPAGLALVRLLGGARGGAGLTTPGLVDPPAHECVDCGAVLEGAVAACPCGGLTKRAHVPINLADRLRFVRRLGAGAMGVVYQATDVRIQQPRAVKTLPRVDPVLLARMRREARHMAAVTHPNLATIHGLEWWHGGPLLVMEYLAGGTLADRLRAGPLTVRAAGEVGVGLARALGALHAQGLLHRDVKPSNIGFAADGTPKLLDFGLAKLVPASAAATPEPISDQSTQSGVAPTDSGTLRGTPAYMSPDVLGGAPPSPGDDLWGLAMVLLEAMTGENPFRAQTVAATAARVLAERERVTRSVGHLPPHARRLFADLLGPREARPKSADRFAVRVQRCIEEGD